MFFTQMHKQYFILCFVCISTTIFPDVHLQNHFCKNRAISFIIAILTLNLLHYNFSTICAKVDLTFCLLIIFMFKVIYADKNFKNMLANHCFNHYSKFLTLP